MRVNIEQKAIADIRFRRLSRELKMPWFAALGAFAYIWDFAEKNKIDTMTILDLDQFIGKKGFASAALACDLLDKVCDDDSGRSSDVVRLRGMRERLAEIEKLSYIQRDRANKRWTKNADGIADGMPSAMPSAMPEKCRGNAPMSLSLSLSNKDKIQNTSGSSIRSESDSAHAECTPNEQIKIEPKNEIVETAAKAPQTMLDPTVPTSTDLIDASGPKKGRKKGVEKETGSANREPNDYFQLLEFFGKTFAEKYGINPPKPGQKEFGIAKKIIKRLDGNLEDAKTLIAHYLSRKEQWYLTKGHALEFCLGDINKLWSEAKTGNIMTTRTAKGLARDEHNSVAGDRAGKFIESGVSLVNHMLGFDPAELVREAEEKNKIKLEENRKEREQLRLVAPIPKIDEEAERQKQEEERQKLLDVMKQKGWSKAQ